VTSTTLDVWNGETNGRQGWFVVDPDPLKLYGVALGGNDAREAAAAGWRASSKVCTHPGLVRDPVNGEPGRYILLELARP
jgi:hypothetical protein